MVRMTRGRRRRHGRVWLMDWASCGLRRSRIELKGQVPEGFKLSRGGGAPPPTQTSDRTLPPLATTATTTLDNHEGLCTDVSLKTMRSQVCKLQYYRTPCRRSVTDALCQGFARMPSVPRHPAKMRVS